MSVATNHAWRNEFGIASDASRIFFASKADLDSAPRTMTQGHILRRAFDLFKLDGVLCTESAPLVYFKELKRADPATVADLHRKLWNHGGAPILVLVTPHQVHVYSGLVRPVATPDRAPGFVETLDRASAALREFLPKVESGEFFRQHQKSGLHPVWMTPA